MAKKKTQPKAILNKGQISPVVVISLLLVVVIGLAVWVYLDNRNSSDITEETPAGVQDAAQNPLEALPQSPEGASVPTVGP